MTNNEIAKLATHCRTLLRNSGFDIDSEEASHIVCGFFSGAMCLNFERTGSIPPYVTIMLMSGRHMELLDVQPTEEQT